MSGSHIGRWALGLALVASVCVGAVWAAEAGETNVDKGTVAGQIVSPFDLPPGASITIEFDVVVDDPLGAGVTFVSNQGDLTGSNFPALSTVDPDPTPDPSSDDATDTLVTAGAILGLTKTDGDTVAVPGGVVSYLLGYINTGNQDAGSAELSDTVPAGTTFNAGASTAGWACAPDNSAGSVCTLALGDLAGNGGSGMATFAVTVVNPVPAGFDQVSNTASLGATGLSPVLASDTTPVTAAPDIFIDKFGPAGPVTPGDTVTFGIDYGNNGNEDAANGVLTETVPVGTTFNAGASTAGWVCAPDNNAGSTCTLDVGTVPGNGDGTSASFAVDVINPVPAGFDTIANTAELSATDAGSVQSMATVPVVAAPALDLTKDDGGVSVAPGDTISYSLDYANNGDQDASDTSIVEVVPAGTTFNAGASTAGWICAPDGNAGSTCVFPIGPLAGGGAGGTATFAVDVINPVPAGFDLVSNSADLEASNATTSNGADTTPVIASPSLSLTKDDGGITAAPGDTIAYALDYGNSGNQDADGVELEETVPVGTTFDPGASTAGWVCVPDNNAGSDCTLDLGTLGGAGGDDGTATFAVIVDDPVSAGFDEVVNVASLNSESSPPVVDGDSTPVNAAPDLTVTKDDGGVTLEPGDTVVYTVSYGNAGNEDATGVELTETVPDATVFNAGASDAGWVCAPDGNPGATCTLTAGGTGDLGGGENGTVDFAVDVDDPLPPGTISISNTVSIADDGGGGPDGNPDDNTFTLVTSLDSDPPVITLVRTTEGPLAACDTIRRPTRNIEISFDDLTEVLGADDAANYQLVASGPDGAFSTTDCGAVLGDDVAVPLSVDTSGAPNQPVSLLSAVAALDGSLYQLLVCDGITDVVGNALDGDGDGESGGNLLLSFRADPSNLFVNAHFDDCPVELAPWTFTAVAPNSVEAGVPGVDDVDGSPLSASASLSNVIDSASVFGQCTQVLGSGSLDFRVRTRFTPVTDGVAFLRLDCAYFPVAACAGPEAGSTNPVLLLLEDTAGEWSELGNGANSPLSVPAETRSVQCSLTIEADGLTDPNFEANLDAFFLTERGFFADGFESGDTAAWSATQP